MSSRMVKLLHVISAVLPYLGSSCCPELTLSRRETRDSKGIMISCKDVGSYLWCIWTIAPAGVLGCSPFVATLSSNSMKTVKPPTASDFCTPKPLKRKQAPQIGEIIDVVFSQQLNLVLLLNTQKRRKASQRTPACTMNSRMSLFGYIVSKA